VSAARPNFTPGWIDGEIVFRGRYFRVLYFALSQSGRTAIFEVQEGEGPATLGCISWYASWRCYGFFPNRGTVFEETCLLELFVCCGRLTQQHRNRARGAKS
jgi:hypothetical protein